MREDGSTQFPVYLWWFVNRGVRDWRALRLVCWARYVVLGEVLLVD